MQKSKVTLLEQETICLFNREERWAEIFTHEPSLKNRLKKLSKEFPDLIDKKREDRYGAVTYTLPKELITVRAPRSKKQLTEEQREALREQLRENTRKKTT